MNKDQCRMQLVELLNAQNSTIARANDYLTSIKTAIAENKLDNLDQFLSNPQLPTEEIEQLQQQRQRLLQNFGFSSDNEGFEKCVGWCDNSDAQVEKSHQQMIAGLAQLQRSIQLNSLLVRKGQERLRRSIGILTGLGNTKQCKTYGSKGQTLQNSNQSNLATA